MQCKCGGELKWFREDNKYHRICAACKRVLRVGIPVEATGEDMRAALSPKAETDEIGEQ